MNKFVGTLENNKWIHIFLIILIGLVLSILLINIQIEFTHDGLFHLFRLIGINDTISLNQIPPIVIPNYCNNFGYSMVLFYPPFVTYIPLLFKLLTPSYSIALKIYGAFCIILSGLTMYSSTYEITKKRNIALFSAFVYLISQYKLGSVYVRYSIGEFTALVFLPLLFKGLYSLLNGDKKYHYNICVAACLLIFSHTITSYYAMIFGAIYVLFNIKKLKSKDILIKLIINIVFIIFITSLFTMPILEAELQTDYAIFSDRIMHTTSNFVKKSSLNLSAFIFDGEREYYDISFKLGTPILILLLLSFYSLFKIDKEDKKNYIIFLLFSIFSLFMCTKYFPWNILPNFLCKLQFPWRMIGFFDFFSSIVCGINICIVLKCIKKHSIKIIVSMIVIILSIVYTICLLQGYRYKNKVLDDLYTTIDNDYAIGAFEYLPENAYNIKDTYIPEREDRIYILEGKANINNENKDKLSYVAKIENGEENAILEFPYIFYPGYDVKIKENGEIINLKSFASQNGFVAVKLPKEIVNGKVEVQYNVTIITRLSNIISILSIMIFVVYIYNYKKEIK